jgi:pyruvate/2-oxoglutarate/acetoin dehydrogenase E1 component
LDEGAVLASAKKTGRVVVLQEAPKFCSYGSEISALIAEEAIEYMEAPIVRVAGFDTPFPYTLENLYMPSPNRVLNAIDTVMEY